MRNYTLASSSLRALQWLKMPTGNSVKMYLLRWGKCILLYFYEQCLFHRIIFTVGHAPEIYICSTEYSSLWQLGFYIILHLKNSFICFGICKRKEKKERCDLVDNKITFVLNSIMPFFILKSQSMNALGGSWECPPASVS